MNKAEKLFSEAMHEYGRIRFENAAKLLAQPASEGHAGAQYVRGFILNTGTGIHTGYSAIPTDHEQAAELLQQAAAQGHPGSLFEMGRRYETGLDVEKDLQQAVSCYEQAALQGHLTAQLWLGFIYDEGTGVEPDHRKADFWWKLAADQGNVVAAYERLSDSVKEKMGESAFANDYLPFNPFGMPVLRSCHIREEFIDYGADWTYRGSIKNSLPEGEGVWKEEYETSGPYDTEITHTTTYSGQFHHGLLHGFVVYEGPSAWFAQFPKEYGDRGRCFWRAGSFVGIME